MQNKFLSLVLVVLFLSPSAMALTAQERKIIQAAQSQIEIAIQDYAATKTALTNAQQQAADADSHAAITDQAAGVLKKQVDDAYAREKALAIENAKMKPVYDECTKWFGLGAFVYGFKELIKHLLILAGVVIVLGVVVLVLVIIFPWLIPIFVGIIGAINSAIQAILAMFKRKPKP